jgi:2'-5' RNA ligase
MRKILFLFTLLFSIQTFAAKKLSLSNKVYDNSSLPFLDHSVDALFGSYLTMEIQFAPVAELFKDLLLQKRTQLTNRGEAHITVISPIEYDEVLKPGKVTIEEINQIARNSNIQLSQFKVICLGMGEAQILTKKEKAFFIVVQSDDLIEIRREVKKLFVSKNGDPSLFDENKFYPHITLGFTNRDLHERDGVIKNEDSCHLKLEVL